MKKYHMLILVSVFLPGACQQGVKQNSHPGGLFTLLFRKTGNGWRIVYDHILLQNPIK